MYILDNCRYCPFMGNFMKKDNTNNYNNNQNIKYKPNESNKKNTNANNQNVKHQSNEANKKNATSNNQNVKHQSNEASKKTPNTNNQNVKNESNEANKKNTTINSQNVKPNESNEKNISNENTNHKSNESNHKNTLCEQFANILGGKVIGSKVGGCIVERPRNNLRITISGRPVSTVITAKFSYESMDISGRTLNLGETVVLESEINKFINVLRKNEIDIAALHNHWIYDNPKILYVHFQSTENPLDFARKVAEAFKVLK
ncbi:DUF1259 domain-containing protein [Clostridium sp. WILCCON 0269]|uniref:DUF1259 domain-containing protein n=1 Tax=Candidatus Clostridium eludens TaxID=3381663 RepID=A0ABW8SL04_9CLOT